MTAVDLAPASGDVGVEHDLGRRDRQAFPATSLDFSADGRRLDCSLDRERTHQRRPGGNRKGLVGGAARRVDHLDGIHGRNRKRHTIEAEARAGDRVIRAVATETCRVVGRIEADEQAARVESCRHRQNRPAFERLHGRERCSLPSWASAAAGSSRATAAPSAERAAEKLRQEGRQACHYLKP